jgi:SAM-dependent methyltransferase
MSGRLEREREYHDRAFADNVRASAKRFYVVNGEMHDWYLGELAAFADGARALEYGCGPGSSAFRLARQGAHVVGIDISPVAIEQATEEGRREGLDDRLEFRVMDAEQLEFADSSFDLVCGSGILHHLDLTRSFAEIARVLKPTGVGLFTEPLGHNPAINAYRRRTPGFRTVDEHPLLIGDFELARRFFDDVSTRYFTLTTLAAVPLRDRPGFAQVLGGLVSLDRLLFKAVPPLRRHAWMVGLMLRGPRA